MKSKGIIYYIFILTSILCSTNTHAQNINTFAGGNGVINSLTPVGIAVNSTGNIYIAESDNSRVRIVSDNGIIFNIAGYSSPSSFVSNCVMTNQYGFGGDGGIATVARLNHPTDVSFDKNGNIYIADAQNNRIRKINASGNISTIAGNGLAGFSGDGLAAANALLNNPTDVAIDTAGNIYIVDNGNNRIRKINTSGIITTIAGNNTAGFFGDNGPATSANLNHPTRIFCYGDKLYIADKDNNRIRLINGSGIITTVAGNGTPTFSGDNGSALTASLTEPSGVCVDASGNLYIADKGNNRVRKVNTIGTIITVAGDGTQGYSGDGATATAAQLQYPIDVAFDAAGNLYISDSGNAKIRKVSTSAIITTVAGSGSAYNNGDNGLSVQSSVCDIAAIAHDASGNTYFSEPQNQIIRKINANGIITTIAGTGIAGYVGDGGDALDAKLYLPEGIAVNNNNIYFADKGNNCIRKIDAAGVIETIAGDGTQGYSGDGGPAVSATLNHPTSVAVDASGNIYIVDNGNNCIRMINPGGTITTIAGTGSAGYNGDAIPATTARLNNPYKVIVSNTNELYVSDVNNHRIRKIVIGGDITTIAGSGFPGFSGDGGQATAAQIAFPMGITKDNYNLYIVDSFNSKVRIVNQSGVISTYAGTGTAGYNGDGIPATNANLYYPHDISFSLGGIYISDAYNARIRNICTGTLNNSTTTITANPSGNICTGTVVTYTANTTSVSAYNVVYVWKKNGQIVHTSTDTYIDSTLSNGDNIQCTVYINTPCAANAAINSNTLTATVNAPTTLTATISTPTTSVCSGIPITFTATTNASSANYQWKVNGTNAGTNAATFSYTPANTDQITCVVSIPSGSCYTNTSVTSNAIAMSVNTSVAATATISVPSAIVCTGNTVTVTATTNVTGGTYQWQVNNVNTGTNSNTLTFIPANGNQVACIITAASGTCYTPSPVTSNNIALSVLSNTTATLSITTPNTTICSGTQATFTATTNIIGGTYQWQVNGGNVGINSSTYTYTPANGNNVKCIVTAPANTCYTPSPVTSNQVTMTVNTTTAPTISIATPNTTLCAGIPATYTATTNVTGGTYQWQVNGTNVGTNSSTYTYIPTNNDQIYCIITTPTGQCYSAPNAGSNTIVMTVNPLISPTASIATSFTTVCTNTNTTFTATCNVPNVSYTWKVNGTTVGGNTSTYTYIPVNGDQVYCIITMPATGCYTVSSLNTNTITMTVNPYVTPNISISSTTNNICLGSILTFTSTSNIVNGSYQWKVNNINVGPNSSTYTYTPANGDVITCTITPPAGCYSPATATSGSITITVSATIIPTISVSGNTTICSGTSTTYTATTNVTGGTLQWYLNGNPVGTNSPTYTYIPTNGDVLSCKITCPVPGCYTIPTVTSSNVTVTVTSNTTPTISITGNNPVCVGASVTYSATTNITSGASYQWTVNGTNVATTPSYTFIPTNGNLVACTLNPPAGCYQPATATSNTINMVVADTIPTINISGTTIAPIGGNVTINATLTHPSSNYVILWYNHGVYVTSTTVPVYTYTKGAGTDSITAMVVPLVTPCYDSSLFSNIQVVQVQTVGVAHISGNNQIQVYPNPFSNTLYINGAAVGDKAAVYDLLGNKVSEVQSLNTTSTDWEFNIKDIASGTYFMILWDSNGLQKSVVPVIKR